MPLILHAAFKKLCGKLLQFSYANQNVNKKANNFHIQTNVSKTSFVKIRHQRLCKRILLSPAAPTSGG